MVVIAPPNPETRSITTNLTDLEKRMRRAEAGLRAAQLGNSSLNASGIAIYDQFGMYRGTLGVQADGTVAATSVNNPNPPPVPAAPIVVPGIASLIVKATGETESGEGWPADFSHVNIYTARAANSEEWTLRGSLFPIPNELPIAPLEYEEYYVTVTAVNYSGKESAKSQIASGTPSQVVPQDLIDGIFADVALAENAVTEAVIAAKAVTKTKIGDAAIESPHITAGAILSEHIAVGQIQAGHIIAGAITAGKIAALAITADKVAANAIIVGKIAAGAVTAVVLEANLVLASQIIAGSATGSRVRLHPLMGLEAFRPDGVTRTLWADAATGNVSLVGTVQAGTGNDRVVIQPNSSSGVPEILFYSLPNNPAYINAVPTSVNGTSIDSTAIGINSGPRPNIPDRQTTIFLRPDRLTIGYTEVGSASGRGGGAYFDANIATLDSAQSSNGVIRSSVIVGNTNVNILAQDIFLTRRNSSGGTLSGSQLGYTTSTGSNYPHLYAVSHGVGLVFDGSQGGYVACVQNGTLTRLVLEASSFRIGSDLSLKDDVEDIDFDAIETIVAAPSQKWKLKGDKTKQGNNAPWHFGPMANDLPPVLRQIDDNGIAKIDLGSMIGILWAGVKDLAQRVDELENSGSPQ
jgi:hypothetical protein